MSNVTFLKLIKLVLGFAFSVLALSVQAQHACTKDSTACQELATEIVSKELMRSITRKARALVPYTDEATCKLVGYHAWYGCFPKELYDIIGPSWPPEPPTPEPEKCPCGMTFDPDKGACRPKQCVSSHPFKPCLQGIDAACFQDQEVLRLVNKLNANMLKPEVGKAARERLLRALKHGIKLLESAQ